ncbi:MAG: spermidine synthase, partial [Alphaproteobacteria bacterium]|nr:spermidine synthase [Alphaproteobacteria bacterium]
MTSMRDGADGPSAAACGWAAFVSAAGALALEIAAARAIAPFTGNSLHIWTAIIAAVVSGFALGHWLGGRLADAPKAVAARRLAATFVVASLACLLCLSLLALLSNGFRLPRGAPVPASLAKAFGLFLLPTAAAGAVSPILAKLAVDADPGRTGRTLGRMFALGTAG